MWLKNAALTYHGHDNSFSLLLSNIILSFHSYSVLAGMIEKVKPEVEPQVALAQQIIAKMGDFTSMTEEEYDGLYENIQQLADIFVEVGDINVFPEEISAIFVKVMSCLPIQCSMRLYSARSREAARCITGTCTQKCCVAY